MDLPAWNAEVWVELEAAVSTDPAAAEVHAAVADLRTAITMARAKPIESFFASPGEVTIRSEAVTRAIHAVSRALAEDGLEDVRALLEPEDGTFLRFGDEVSSMDAASAEASAARIVQLLAQAVAARGGAVSSRGHRPTLLTGGERLTGMVAPLSVPAAPAAIATGVDPVLVERLRGLVGKSDTWTERRSLECQDPLALARAGLSILRDLPESWDVQSLLSGALERVVDRTPVRDAMIALWAEPAPAPKYWKRLVHVLEPAASDPGLLATLTEIVLADSGDLERRRHAIELLSRARAAWQDALPALLQRLRQDRDRTTDDARWREAVLEAIGRLGRPEAVPSLVLELAAETPVEWSTRLRALVAAGGDAALPWLRRAFPCSRAAEAVVDSLEEVPDALPWLRELGGDPEPRFRTLAGRYLGRRGDSELPWVAAIWKSLDAIGYERTSGFREDALIKLGVPRDQTEADWDALVRHLGAEPVALPPVGDTIDGLTLPDDRSVMALERLARSPDPSALLALVLGLELHEARRRRGSYPPVSSPIWHDWRTAIPAWPFAGVYGLSNDMLPWLRAHRAELPPQRLTPGLQEILDDGPDEVAARAAEPGFRLDPAEQITFDAAERALIASWDARQGRGASAVSAPATTRVEPTVLPSDATDLFGVVLEMPPERRPPAPHESPTPIVEDSLDGEVLTLPAGCATCSIDRSDPSLSWFSIDAVLENRLPRPVKLLAIELALRDADGNLADHARRILRDQFWHHHELSERIAFSQGAFERARTVDVYVTHEIGFRTRLLAADLTPYDGSPLLARTPWPFALRPIAPAYPDFDARLAVFLPPASYVRCEVVLELSQRTPLREPSAAEVPIIVRNRGGSVLERTVEKVTLEANGPTFVHADCLGLTQDSLRAARRVEVAIAGTTRRTERLAAFRLTA